MLFLYKPDKVNLIHVSTLQIMIEIDHGIAFLWSWLQLSCPVVISFEDDSDSALLFLTRNIVKQQR